MRGRIDSENVSRFALVAAIAPIVAVAIRNLGSAVALGDAGYFVARSRDVLTSHHPFIGAYSSGSAGPTDNPVNNVGPLQLDLLAPFTKLDPYWGAVVGTAALSIASVVGVWLVARRMFSPLGVSAAMFATIVLEASIGTELLVDARQQATLILPFWCLLWCAAGVAAGMIWELPALAFLASLTIQTHLSYVIPTVTVVCASLLVLAAGAEPPESTRPVDRLRRSARPLTVTALVLAGAWVQTLWDQLFGSGNLGKVATAGGDGGIGLRQGAGVVADSVLLPPFGLFGHLDGYLVRPVLDQPSFSTTRGVVAITLWLAALLAAFAFARRRHLRAPAAAAAIGIAANIGAIAAASGLPATPQFGIVGQNYFWMWPIGAFAVVGIVAGLATVLIPRTAHKNVLRATGVVVVLAAAPLLAISPDYWDDRLVDERTARMMLDDIAPALADAGISGPVVFDFISGVGGSETAFMTLAELQDAGVEFRFPAGSLNRERFGRERCADGSERWLLRPFNGVAENFEPPAGELVLIDIDTVPVADAQEVAQLDMTVADAIRDGDIVVDEGGAEFFGYPDLIPLRALKVSSERSATGLAPALTVIDFLGFVDVDESVRDDWDRWLQLSERNAGRRLALFAAPNPYTGDQLCR